MPPSSARSAASPPSRPRAALPPATGRDAAGRVPRRLPADRDRGRGARRGRRDPLVPRPHLVGRTYVPGDRAHDTGLELFGYVSFAPGDDDGASEPSDFASAPTTPTRRAERPSRVADGHLRGGRSAAGAARAAQRRGDDAGLGRARSMRRRPRGRPPSSADLAVDQCDDRRRPLHAARARRLPRRLPRRRAVGRATGASWLRESLYVEDEDDE